MTISISTQLAELLPGGGVTIVEGRSKVVLKMHGWKMWKGMGAAHRV
jgi:hypothetical protein